MAQEPWNKVHIPFPSAVSSIRIAFRKTRGVLIERLLADCKRALTLLCSEVLQTEIRVMYELLYILNNSFRQHKPFRSLKQVEQCINRLKEMKLQGAIGDLTELCPNKYQRDAGIDVGECDVPSQPMLEWICLKLLGASSLLARTLERCTQAFLNYVALVLDIAVRRTRQHLHLGEFIVLNVVITSMLSRLWVFFRGLLSTLIPIYGRTIELLLMVRQSQPMAYLTDFTLPGNLKDFLFHSHPDLPIEDDFTKPAWASRWHKKHQLSILGRLFGKTKIEEDKGQEERGVIPVLASGHYEGSRIDLGTAVQQQRPEISSYGLDIKAMLQQPCQSVKQIMSQGAKLGSSRQVGVSQKRKLLNLLRKVSSFSNMTAQLKEVIHWCRSCKLHQVRKRVSYLLLKCLRMESLEADGIRVEKRLKTFKIKAQKALMLQNDVSLKCSSSFSAIWRMRWHRRTSIRSFMTSHRTTRQSAFARMSSKTVKELFAVSLKNRRNCSPVDQQKEVSGHNVASTCEKDKMHLQTVIQKPVNFPKNDIDDIFASIGF